MNLTSRSALAPLISAGREPCALHPIPTSDKYTGSGSAVNDQLPGAHRRARNRGWSQEEDARLRQGVQLFGAGSWSVIASYVGNGRTRAQCSQRWFRGINPAISRVKWTEEEMEKLLALVAKYGSNQWVKVAAEMENRCDVQCRYKYAQIQRNLAKNAEREGTAPPKLPSIADILNVDAGGVDIDAILNIGDQFPAKPL